MEILKCPVCHNLLSDYTTLFKCLNNHSFDKNKKGYTNLLLSNQLHSLDPGDNKEMVNARSNFLKSDKYISLRNMLFESINKYKINDSFTFLDIACGEGYYTNYLMSKFTKANGVGIDLSKYALINAIRNKKELNLNNINYYVASLTKLPFLDNSIDIALNCFAPLDEIEFSRVLKDKGIFIRVLPNTYHLYELKKVLYNEVKLNEEKDSSLTNFTLLEIKEVDDVITLNNIEINNLFMMTPYYYKSPLEGSNKLKSLNELKTRISFKIYIYQKN